ncbi:MAG: M3 family oligoendopeptidase [Methanomassiliicoccales archaeon]
MRWDLSVLVKEVNVDKIKEELNEMVRAALVIKEIYSGRIKGFDSKGILELLKSLDAFLIEFDGVSSYCSLRYAADSTDATAKQLNEALRNAYVKVGQALAFIEIELGQLLLERPDLIYSLDLHDYRHYLERIRLRAPYHLTEEIEQLIIVKDRNGINAWSQLHNDWLGTKSFQITIDGIEKELSYGEAVGLFTSPNRELRKLAYSCILRTLAKDEVLFSSALRAICSDYIIMCNYRKFPQPITPSLLANDIDMETLVSLLKVVENKTELYRQYLRIKAKLLNVEKLGIWDLMAPLPSDGDATYKWMEARKLITKAFSDFDPDFGRWIEEMYVARRIDGEVRRGKSPGAFCHTWLTGKGAFILQSFNGRLTDVYTQAHELGHAIHAYLYTREQPPLNCEIGSCIAECGSTFGELLLTERLLAEAKNVSEKKAALVTVLDEFGLSVFQVAARYWFEEGLYKLLQDEKLLDGDTLKKMWCDCLRKIFGDDVELLPETCYDWIRPPHYYIANYRFYNFPYIFAQLFVFSLYRLYKEQGKNFVPKLKVLLAAGASRAPKDLARDLGYDISSMEFWEKGMRQAEEFLDSLKKTL